MKIKTPLDTCSGKEIEIANIYRSDIEDGVSAVPGIAMSIAETLTTLFAQTIECRTYEIDEDKSGRDKYTKVYFAVRKEKGKFSKEERAILNFIWFGIKIGRIF